MLLEMNRFLQDILTRRRMDFSIKAFSSALSKPLPR
jgi:hypothetical protein